MKKTWIVLAVVAGLSVVMVTMVSKATDPVPETQGNSGVYNLPVLVLPTLQSFPAQPASVAPSGTPPSYGTAPVLVTPVYAKPKQLATAGIAPKTTPK